MPECDIGNSNNDIVFDQPWLSHAIPKKNDKFDNCFRYAPKNSTATPNALGTCSADMFDTTTKIACTEFIHASNEINVQTEVS